MRNFPPSSCTPGAPGSPAARRVVLGLAMVAAAAPAYADGDLTGAYEVKFEQVSTNCEHPLAYPPHGTIKIEVKGGDVQIDIDRTPIMVGKSPKPNKANGVKAISAKSPRAGHTPIQGMDGRFSVAGRINPDGMLSLVMVGEYQTGGKPLCSQSWNVSGLQAPPDKPDKPKK